MRRLYISVLLFVFAGFLFYSCEQDTKTAEQKEREEIMAVEDLLRDKQWAFYDLSVSVLYESRALPLLVNVADENGMVQPGIYDSYAIFGNSKRQLYYTYEFGRDDIMADTSNSGDFHKFGGYYVLNTSQIRVNPDSGKAVKFAYEHLGDENKFILSTNGLYNEELISNINSAIVNSVLSERPSEIAEKFVDFLQGNEKVSKAIEQLLYNLIHSRIDEITQSPEEKSEELARVIVQKLGEIDWEELLYDKILDFLLDLQAENPEEKAEELAQRIADKIEASLTKSDVYGVLLPLLENFENETLPALASQLSAGIYEKITEALSEENLYNRIYPVWEDLAGADTVKVREAADTLASIVSAHFFAPDTLSEKLIPFVQKIDETSTFKLGQLSQEIIDSVLIPTIADINEAFPALGLDPDWGTIKPVITSVLTALKAALASSTVEELSAQLADSLIGIMDLVLQKGFEKAIYSLQEIPPEQAASVMASWLINLLELVEQPVVDFIEGKLDAIFDLFEAERAAEELSAAIYEKLIEIFSEENLYKLVLPLLEAFQTADLEKIAETIATWIIELDIMSDKITEEQLITALTAIISDMIGTIDPENAAERLVELILESELVDLLDGNLLKRVLESKIYELLYTVGKNMNAINNFEISIQQK